MDRVQISLMVYDKKLYEDLILPYKTSKELTSLILRLLDAYYRSDKVRMITDNLESEPEQEDKTQEIINNIRNTVAVQSFLAEELNMSATQRMGETQDILSKVNKTASDMGIFNEGETQEEQPRFIGSEVSPKIKISEDETSSPTTTPAKPSTSPDVLIASVLQKLCSRLGYTEDAGCLDAILKGHSQVEGAVIMKNASLSSPDEVVLASPKSANDLEETKTMGIQEPTQKVEETPKSEEAEIIAPPPVEEPVVTETEPEEGNARASIMSLLGSI